MNGKKDSKITKRLPSGHQNIFIDSFNFNSLELQGVYKGVCSAKMVLNVAYF